MDNNEPTNAHKDNADGGYIAFSNDKPSSNWRKTPFKSSYSPYQNNRNEPFSPFQGGPQGFSSPIYNQRNFNGNRRQSGNSYGDRFRGNQSHNRGNNWRGRNNDNRKPNHNRSFNKSGCEPGDISEYFHPSMIQDPWKHLLQTPSETNITIDKNFEDNETDTKDHDEPGGSASSSPSE